MPQPASLVHQQSTSTGTGNISLVAVTGRRTFADAYGTGATTNVFPYFAVGQSDDLWEYGYGHCLNATTLVRDTIIKSSNANAPVDFAGGIVDVMCDTPAENQVRNEGGTNADGDVAVMDGTSGRQIKGLTAGAALSGSTRAITSVASASTCDIGAAATDYVNITGTTTITSLGTGANKIRRVRFAGVLTLTYNATSLVLPGAANITTAAGDEAEFVSNSSGNWKCTRYQRSTGLSLIPVPSFSASKSADQTGIPSATLTQITFDTEVFDAGGYFASSAWTPLAGLVMMTASLNLGGTVSVGNIASIAIYKNGVAYRRTNVPALGGANQQAFPSITILERANGTDVYTVYGLLTTNSGTVTASAAIGTFFQGAWLAP